MFKSSIESYPPKGFVYLQFSPMSGESKDTSSWLCHKFGGMQCGTKSVPSVSDLDKFLCKRRAGRQLSGFGIGRVEA